MRVRSVRLAAALLIAASVALAVAPSVSAAAGLHRDSPLHVKVYVIDFDPLVNGQPLSADRGWNDPLALDRAYQSAVRTASGGLVRQRIAHLTVVRGYPVKADGFMFTNASYLGCLADSSPAYCGELIDYGAVLNSVYDPLFGSACQALLSHRVDEVWLWGGPWFGYLEWLDTTPGNLCAGLDRTFVTMGFSYERGLPEMLHDLGHRAEGLILAGVQPAVWDRFDGQRFRYAEDYSCPAAPDATHPEVDASDAHAGNVHFPPNAYCHYQYDRNYPVLSDAYDWANFPNLTGQKSVINDTTWGASQQGFLMWWLERFPRNAGASGPIKYDWWRYVYPSAR